MVEKLQTVLILKLILGACFTCAKTFHAFIDTDQDEDTHDEDGSQEQRNHIEYEKSMIDLQNSQRSNILARIILKLKIEARNWRTGAILSKRKPPVQIARVGTYLNENS